MLDKLLTHPAPSRLIGTLKPRRTRQRELSQKQDLIIERKSLPCIVHFSTLLCPSLQNNNVE